ncbi:MAG: PfkB family carbohydrate kinase [Candidatus Sumerlaeia bacterium]|nr:PfkB family carbohydrate kinase [Candidatus Sumerlaeia bacterium]
MKISVIGTIMRDEIHSASGEKRESFGGILYNIITLASLTRSTDTIEPICCVGERHLDTIKNLYFEMLPQIRLNSLKTCVAGTDENVLRYRTDSDRDEKMTIHTPALADDQIQSAASSAAILLNIINGREITLPQLKDLRSKTRAHIHLDIHNLGKTIGPDGTLTHTGLPNWRDWLTLVDSVQANEWEIKLLTGVKPESEEEFRTAVLQLMSIPHIKAAALTIGGRGAVMAHRLSDESGKVYLLRIPAIPVQQVVDTTGCGDCFSSAFVVGMLRYHNPAKAALMATTLSGLNTRGGGLETLFMRSRKLDKNAQEFYPELFARVSDGWWGEEVEPEEIQRAQAALNT